MKIVVREMERKRRGNGVTMSGVDDAEWSGVHDALLLSASPHPSKPPSDCLPPCVS